LQLQSVPVHVNDILRLKLWDFEDGARAIITQATLETDIGRELDSIEATWEDLTLVTLEKHRPKRFTPSAKDFERYRREQRRMAEALGTTLHDSSMPTVTMVDKKKKHQPNRDIRGEKCRQLKSYDRRCYVGCFCARETCQ
jgi:hypothetical protein